MLNQQQFKELENRYEEDFNYVIPTDYVVLSRKNCRKRDLQEENI